MTTGIVVIGAGGHAKVCVELLQSMGEEVAYCVGGAGASGTCAGAPVLAGDEHLATLHDRGHSCVFVAIGNNSARERLAVTATTMGYTLVSAISPHAVVSKSARLGAGVAVMAGCVINADAEIGDLAIINTGATVDHDCRIGFATHIAPNCALAGNVVVGRRSLLGIGCDVIPGRTIGEGVVIGAGSVVVSDICDGVTAVGVPAKATGGQIGRGDS